MQGRGCDPSNIDLLLPEQCQKRLVLGCEACKTCDLDLCGSGGSGLGCLEAPPALGKCRSGGGCIIVGHVFLQLPVSVSSRNKQGYAWLALHEVAAKRRPRSGVLELTHSYRRGSENCNLHFEIRHLFSSTVPTPVVHSVGGGLIQTKKSTFSAPPPPKHGGLLEVA